MKIPVIKDAKGDFVVVSQIACVVCKDDTYEVVLNSGVRVKLTDDKESTDLCSQFDMYFGE